MIERFKAPAIILALAILPGWVFVGTTSTTVVNGVVIWDEKLNFLGAGCALIGLKMAASALMRRERRDRLRSAGIVFAAVACIAQLAHSLEILDTVRWYLAQPESGSAASQRRGSAA